MPGYETSRKKGNEGVSGKAKQQQLWQAIIIIKAASIKGVNHRAAATFLRRWWNLFRAASSFLTRRGTETELHFYQHCDKHTDVRAGLGLRISWWIQSVQCIYDIFHLFASYQKNTLLLWFHSHMDQYTKINPKSTHTLLFPTFALQ